MSERGTAVSQTADPAPATVPDQQTAVNRLLDRSSDGIDMEGHVEVLSRQTVYRGAIFSVEDMRLRLPLTAEARHAAQAAGQEAQGPVIRRQVLRHAPCVVMLVHDVARDRYVVEREYRVGCDRFAYGLPAGLMNPGETIETAALRELQEETGIAVHPGGYRMERVADCWSSEGMTDELAHIMVLHLTAWDRVPTRPDPDEHVESAWVDWPTLRALPVTASNSVIAIQHEELRRLRDH